MVKKLDVSILQPLKGREVGWMYSTNYIGAWYFENGWR